MNWKLEFLSYIVGQNNHEPFSLKPSTSPVDAKILVSAALSHAGNSNSDASIYLSIASDIVLSRKSVASRCTREVL